MAEGSHEGALSKSKIMRWESDGSIAPKVGSRAFRCIGHVYRTSRTNIANGD